MGIREVRVELTNGVGVGRVGQPANDVCDKRGGLGQMVLSICAEELVVAVSVGGDVRRGRHVRVERFFSVVLIDTWYMDT